MLECRRRVSQDTVRRARGVGGPDGAAWDDLANLTLTQTRDTWCSSRRGDMCGKLRQEKEAVAQLRRFQVSVWALSMRAGRYPSFSTPVVNEFTSARSHEFGEM